VSRSWTERAVFAGAASLLAAAALLPLVALALRLVETLIGEGFAPSLLASPRLWKLLGISLLRAAAVTGAALAVGVPLGLVVARTDAPGRLTAFAFHVLPGLLPPYLLALGWFHLFGRSGILGSEATAKLLFGEVGAVAVLALAFAPLATALTALGAWGMDGALEDAARVAAPPARVLLRIVLPAAAPGISLAALLIFVLAVSELGVPVFLRVDAYPAAVFARLGGIEYAPGEAVALVLPLLGLALALLAVERRLVASRDYAVLGLRGAARSPLPLGRWRAAAAGGCAVAVVLAAAPLVALAVRAARGRGFAELPYWVGGSLGASVVAAAVAATAILMVGLPLAHALVRARPAARLADALAILAFVTPSTVLGVGLIQTWNRAATAWVYGSLAIVIVGFAARYAAVGLRTCASVLAQGSPRLEESAAVLGAGYLRRLAQLLVPLHARGLAAAWLLALVFCLRDLESAILVYPAGRDPLTVRIFTLEANGPEPVVAALACMHVSLIAVALAGLGLLVRPAPRT
jgi:iron(III) transport system permease protein